MGFTSICVWSCDKAVKRTNRVYRWRESFDANIYRESKQARYINAKKRRLILNNKKEIINLIKNDINNNDYLMIKGSNSTGLNKLSSNLKKGNFYAL